MGRANEAKADERHGPVLTFSELEESIIHRDELAKLLGLRSPQMLDVHAREGHLVRADRKGWFKLAPVRRR